jgi:hypothetical protein
LRDILPVCRRCHQAVHDMYKQRISNLRANRNIVRKYLGLPLVRRDSLGLPID